MIYVFFLGFVYMLLIIVLEKKIYLVSMRIQTKRDMENTYTTLMRNQKRKRNPTLNGMTNRKCVLVRVENWLEKAVSFGYCFLYGHIKENLIFLFFL